MTIGAQTRPACFSQYFRWITQHIPISRNLQIVGVAAICWALWKLRNRASFGEQKLIRSPSEIICYACAFLRYWADLQKEADKTNLLAGAAALQAEALRHHDRQACLDMDNERASHQDEQVDRKGKRKAEDDGTQ
ncbi:hypothetical protein BRADI_4g14943v3 [Brachypodium distachyon]|uniref:Uncharacterized protein n=1 Tax=Brachypodium distachyon TaxID=15368 RepID=A0A0Q3PF99_BRADI|nr:hypothetical protein BRADI_4g14943v3 [Brachypodium distachyon]